MILIIGEKPSIAKKIVGGLSLEEKFEHHEGYYISDNYIVTNCVGHLLREALPAEIDEKYKKWRFDNLPFYPDPIPLMASDTTKDQLKVVTKLLKRNDVTEICNACDADREGELIFRNLISFINPKCEILTRMWIESVATDRIMLDTFKRRKTEKLYEGLHEAAIARSYLDYYIGINSTIAMSVKYGNGKPISVGRVITPTLKIITDLENKIKNFKSEKFYKLVADTNVSNDFNYYNEDLDDNRFTKKADAEEVLRKVGTGECKVLELTNKKEKESPPKLFSLSDLQIVLSSKYGYTAQQVLDSVQTLYEKYGLLTYPRTSENHISEEMAAVSLDIVDCLKNVFSKPFNDIKSNGYTINKQVIAKKDIASHEALTPTQKPLTKATYDGLSPMLRNTYDEVVTRFLMNFYPQAVYDVADITIEKNGEIFKKKIKVLTEKGFYELTDKEVGKPIKIDKDNKISILKLRITEGNTEPPKRLTEGALIKIMQSPLKYASNKDSKDSLKEAGGIGTEATRASIIESLKKNEFITVKKNSIYATDKGISLIEMIPSETLKSVDFTASVESKLTMIKDEKFTRDELLDGVKKATTELVSDIENGKELKIRMANSICKCPACGGDIVPNKLGWGCSDYKNCKCCIYKDSVVRMGAKKPLTEKQAKDLLTKGVTSTKLKFTSKRTGKEFECKLSYEFNPSAQYPNELKFKFE